MANFMDIGGIFALATGFAMFAFILFIVGYVFFALVLMTIAQKTKTPNPWLAWIPIANLYLALQIAKMPWWWLLVFLFGWIIPIVGTLGVIVLSAWMWWRIAEARKKPGWWGILVMIPIVGIVFMAMLAWSD